MKVCVSFCLKVALVGLCGLVSQELDPEVLIDKYNSCNKKLQTIYYELETTTQYGSAKRGKRVHSLKYCSHNEKKQWIGHRTQYKEDGTVDQGSSSLQTDIYGDKMGVHLQFYNPHVKNVRPPHANLVRSSLDKHVQGYTNHPPYGGSLTGQLFGSNGQSIYDLLKRASNLKLHNEVTKIIGYDTYLIEADTKYGIVKAWISPDLDYNCLKWEIIKKDPNQFYIDGTFPNDWFTEWTAIYDAEKVEQIGGQYLITQAKLNYKVDNGDIILVNDTFHFNLKNIDLNPDYEALGAFKIQLPEGTVVDDDDFPGIKYRWIGGKLQPLIDDMVIDVLNSAVDDLKENRNTVPEKKRVEKSDGEGAVQQAAKVDSNQLPDPEIAKVEGEEKDGFGANTKKLVCYAIGVFVILVAGFFVYRHRGKMGDNEKQD